MNSKYFSIYIQIILIYSIGIGIFYLWGYWGAFNIDILPYITIWDIIKFSAFPLFYNLSLFLIGMSFSFYATTETVTQTLENSSPKNSSLFKKIQNGLFFISVVLIPIAIWFKYWFLLIPIIYIIILKAKNRVAFIDGKLNDFVIGILVIIPFIAYYMGIWNAKPILENKNYLYSSITINNQTKILKFLGHVNEHYFFLDSNNQAVFIYNKINVLALKTHKIS